MEETLPFSEEDGLPKEKKVLHTDRKYDIITKDLQKYGRCLSRCGGIGRRT